MGRSHANMYRGLLIFAACVATWTITGQTANGDAAADQPGGQQAAAERVLAMRCLQCHSGTTPEGDLDLARRETALRGGESGPAIVPGDLEQSRLWQRVRDGAMPPDEATPLTAAERDILQQWVLAGAAYRRPVIDGFAYTTEARAGYNWWAFQPLTVREPPIVAGPSWGNNAIDAFVLAGLRNHNLEPSPRAGPRALIRRLYFDLIGLPPTLEQVETFVADPTSEAYARIVDDLLASPHYGERWGRHWLDLARFGESDGFERNHPRENQWHYRDWVIKALNADMPYPEFARQQIAGDLMTPGREGLAAAAFLTAGVHNTVVGGSEFMKKSARQDELEEIAAAVGQTFLGLTINCARCHDHKFDPVSQVEYYRFVAALGGVFHGEREYRDPQAAAQAERLQTQLAAFERELAQIENPIRAQILSARKADQAAPIAATVPQPTAVWEFDATFLDQSGQIKTTPVGAPRIEDGALVFDDGQSYVETEPLAWNFRAKTLEALVQLSNLDQRGGGVISLQTLDGVVFDAIVFGERSPRRWMSGSNGFVRSHVHDGPEETSAVDQPVHLAIVYREDGTIERYRNGRPYGESYSSTLQPFASGAAVVRFGIRHLPAGGNKHMYGRIHRAQLYDRALSPEEVAAAAGANNEAISAEEIVARLSPADALRHAGLIRRQKEVATRLQDINEVVLTKVYTVKPESNPGVTHVLQRGNAMDPASTVRPGGIKAVQGVSPDFRLPADATDLQRRQKLADWIADSNNPLLARVIVNRLWHHHFGKGLVATPSDFGFNGGRPSHPELLDWLAVRLRDQNWSLKEIHRLMVKSATYQQASFPDDAGLQIDAENRLLWRKSPQRLDAESLRDSMLFVAGRLNTKRFGPGFRDVTVEYVDGTTYYRPTEEENTEFNRRTIYRFSPRGGRTAILDTFDCPDPATAAPRRTVTTTPLQALALLNNGFALRIYEQFGKRVTSNHGVRLTSQVNRAYQFALARRPDADEQRLGAALLRAHGPAALARVLLNSNEFITIE